MKKSRITAILLALLLLCLPLIACGGDEQPPATPDQGNTQAPQPQPGADQNGGTDDATELPNTDPDADPDTDPDYFLAQNGYPMDFSVRFERDGYGFDVATNTILNGSESVTYVFTAADLQDIYRCLDNANFWQLPTDLTYSKLTGNSSPEGPGVQYKLTVSAADRTPKTCSIDGAAIARLADNANVSNLGNLVAYLDECVAIYHQNATA